jgi:hypothetical protein
MDARILTGAEIDAMSAGEFKVYENLCRRAAQRQGYKLVKSRRRDPRAADFGSYWLIDHDTGGAVEGGEWGTDLAVVAAWLWGDDDA